MDRRARVFTVDSQLFKEVEIKPSKPEKDNHFQRASIILESEIASAKTSIHMNKVTKEDFQDQEILEISKKLKWGESSNLKNFSFEIQVTKVIRRGLIDQWIMQRIRPFKRSEGDYEEALNSLKKDEEVQNFVNMAEYAKSWKDILDYLNSKILRLPLPREKTPLPYNSGPSQPGPEALSSFLKTWSTPAAIPLKEPTKAKRKRGQDGPMKKYPRKV